MNRRLTAIITLAMIGCNSNVDKTTSKQTEDTIPKATLENVNPPKLNHRDNKGLKQGQWKQVNSRQEVEIFTYRNDTLDGYYSVGNLAWRHEGNYKNGKLHGIVRTYAGTRVEHIRCYDNDKPIWVVSYAEDVNHLIPLKGFQITDDTVLHVVAPFPSGKTWYEGDFISTKKFKSKSLNHFETFMTGIHKIYFESGRLRGQVDYNHKTITEYDSSGKQLYRTTFDDIDLHKQTIKSLYLK